VYTLRKESGEPESRFQNDEKEIPRMKRVIGLMAALVLVTLMGSLAQAQQVCYQLKPFGDVIKLSYHLQGSHTNLFGNWSFDNAYSLPVVGAREANLNGGPKRVSLHGTNDTSDFGGNPICALDGVVNGAFTFTCVGGSNGTFTNAGTGLTPVSCTAAPQREGPVAGK
jgi:hypothetical protein